MRVTLVISSLGGGGAERVVSNMANHWAARGWEVTILTVSHGARAPVYDLHASVTRRDLGHSRDSYLPVPDTDSLRALHELYEACSRDERSIFVSDLNLVAALRHALQATRPDIVISFMDITNIRVLAATHGLNIPVIVSERCDPGENFLGAGRERLRHRLYPRAKYLTVLTEEIRQHFFPVVGECARVIPNPVLPPVCRSDGGTGVRRGAARRVLTAMGRLDYEKGFDLLIYAFASIAAKHPSWHLRIYGEGRLRSELEELIKKLGLSERVSLPGFTKRTGEALSRSDLFVMPSRSEGFGNSLAEAMACGQAVVSFDCPSGPRHIIRDGSDGVLVPPGDVPALAATLDRLMGDDAERRRLAASAPDVLERFGMEKVMEMWEQLITDQESEQ